MRSKCKHARYVSSISLYLYLFYIYSTSCLRRSVGCNPISFLVTGNTTLQKDGRRASLKARVVSLAERE